MSSKGYIYVFLRQFTCTSVTSAAFNENLVHVGLLNSASKSTQRFVFVKQMFVTELWPT